jgi:hypothetical protein
MKGKTLKKVKLSVLALAAVTMFVGAPRADASEHRHHNHVYYGYAYPQDYNGGWLGHGTDGPRGGPHVGYQGYHGGYHNMH